MPDISKSDWKLFMAKVPDWQEAYMQKLCRDYVELLCGDGYASEKFWNLEKRIKEDKRKPGVQLEMRKSEAFYDLLTMLRDGAITLDDLSDFSPDLKEAVRAKMNEEEIL